MKKYNSPEMEIVLHNIDDVVRTSPVTDWGASPYLFNNSNGFTFTYTNSFNDTNEF